MAALAAAGGILSISCSIGIPLYTTHRGGTYTPMFSLFAAWGVAALIGSYACLKTYLITDMPPPKPPGGGVRLEFRRESVAPPAAVTKSPAPPQRRAA